MNAIILNAPSEDSRALYAGSVRRFRTLLDKADTILIGAGSGLSTAAGLTYSGKRFHHYFYDFASTYGIRDMYSGGFYPFDDERIYWAWWSRHIYINRYVDAPSPVYSQLLDLVRGKDYFVLTTNVDHQFQRAGFEASRLFYTQGDYGRFQSVSPQIPRTYGNEQQIYTMVEAQGFVKNADGVYDVPDRGNLSMKIPIPLIPRCPDDGSPMVPHLRVDDTFVEDEGWYDASRRYHDFLRHHSRGRILYLELGVGMNTPGIIKFPFWSYTADNPQARYICLNHGEAFTSREIEKQSLCINGDIARVLCDVTGKEMLYYDTGRTPDLAHPGTTTGNGSWACL